MKHDWVDDAAETEAAERAVGQRQQGEQGDRGSRESRETETAERAVGQTWGQVVKDGPEGVGVGSTAQVMEI